MLAMARFHVFSPIFPLLAFSIHTATQLAHTILILDTAGHQQGVVQKKVPVGCQPGSAHCQSTFSL